MPSFQRVIAKGKNGKSVAVNGKTRNSIPRLSFIRICKEENGDCRKISQRLYGDEKHANQVSLRYENLVKKGIDLPKMIFVKLRTHVPVTPEMQRKLVEQWNLLKGDTKAVATKLGISTATVYSWVKKFDYLSFKANVLKRAMKNHEDYNEFTQEEKDIALEEAENELMEEGTFNSIVCEKKAGKRGKKSSEVSGSIISDIEDLLANLDEEENEEEEETLEEKIEEVIG